MRLNPRANEVKAVVDLMESDGFDTPEKLAKAIVVAVAEELSHRTTQGIAAGFPGEGRPMAVGPFYHSADIQKWVEEAQEAGLETLVCRLSSPDALRPVEAGNGGCSECSHAMEMHALKAEGCVYMANPKDGKTCGCRRSA